MKQGSGVLVGDALASIVVFLVALPLCTGIAIASGVPPILGMVTGIIGGIVVGLIAGCPLQVSGPAAGLVAIVVQLVQDHGLAMLGPIVLLAGLIQLAAGLLKLGGWFRAIAPSVIYGMLAGIGILIGAAQFHVMIDDTPRSNGLQNLITIPVSVWKAVSFQEGTSHHVAAMLGLVTLGCLLAWAKWAPGKLKMIPGPLVGVVVASSAAAIWKMEVKYVTVPESVMDALNWASGAGLARMAEPSIIIAALALAFVASAETLLCATAVDRMHDGPRTKYDRELAAQGIGNVLCGVVGALPMTGVIVRSSANVASGAKTRASAILHGVWLFVLVLFAAWLLNLIPISSLAAVLVYTGYKLVNVQHMKRLSGYGKPVIAIYAATLGMIVVKDLLTGIVVGLVLSLIKLLYMTLKLNLSYETSRDGRRADLHLSGSATFLQLPQMMDVLAQVERFEEVHLHFDRLEYIDHACLDLLNDFGKQQSQKGREFVVEWDELTSHYQMRNTFRRKSEEVEVNEGAAI